MTDIKRRKFTKIFGAGTVCIPIYSIIGSSSLHAEETKMLNPDSPEAQSLQFTIESDKADQRCAKCMFYSSVETAGNGICMVFGGRTVPGMGWCTAFQAKKTM